MRILIVSWFLPPYVGGAENIAAAEILALRARGHEVTVVTGPAPQAPNPPGLVPVRPDLRLPGLHPACDDVQAADEVGSAVAKLLDGCTFDLLYGYLLTYPWAPRRSAAMIDAARSAGLPVVTVELGGNPERDPLQCVELMARVDGIVCCSEFVRRNLRALAAHTLPTAALPWMEVLAPMIVPEDAFYPDPEARHAARVELGFTAEDYVVFFPSRFFDIDGDLSVRKKPLVALDAFIELVRAVPSARLLAILPPGFGNRRSEHAGRRQVHARLLSDGVADRVVLLDRAVSHTEMAHYFRAADVVIVPSQEGFGLVYLEAMACAVPVVAVAEGAAPEVLGDESGSLVAPGPALSARLAEAMAALHADPRLRSRTGAAGLYRYRSLLTGAQWAHRLENILLTARPR